MMFKKYVICFLLALIFFSSPAYCDSESASFWRHHQTISSEINRTWIETQDRCSANSADPIRVVKSRSSNLSSVLDNDGEISKTLELLMTIPNFPAVNSLNFRGSKITEEDLRILNSLAPRMQSVKDLYFGGSEVRDKRALFLFLSKLAPQIEILELSNLNLDSDDAAFFSGILVGMGNLRVMYMDGNKIGDAGLNKLMNQGFGALGKLSILSLKSNNLTDFSIKRFAQSSMPAFGNMQILDLRSNNLSNDMTNFVLKYSFSMPQLLVLDINSSDEKWASKIKSSFLKCSAQSSSIFIN